MSNYNCNEISIWRRHLTLVNLILQWKSVEVSLSGDSSSSQIQCISKLSLSTGPLSVVGGGGLCPRGSLSRGSLSRGCLCPGGLYPGGLCQADPPVDGQTPVKLLFRLLAVKSRGVTQCRASS